MTQSLTNAIAEIADVAASVGGINAPQGTPRENTNEYPYVMVYVITGKLTSPGYGWTEDLVNIAIDLLDVRRDLNDNLPALHPILDLMKVALHREKALDAGTHFNNSIDTFGDIDLVFLPNEYSAIGLIGYRLIMEDVKITGVLT